MTRALSFLLVGAALAALLASDTAAAPPRPELLQDPTFRAKAREVFGRRPERLGRIGRPPGSGRSAASLAAPAATGAAAAKVAPTRGTLRPLILLVDFPDRPRNPTGHEPADYAHIFFTRNGLAAPNTVAEYFDEVSYGQLRIEGDAGSVAGWRTLPKTHAYYLGSDAGVGRAAELVADAVAAQDAAVDFGLFDNDGPDGIPNSGDDDGYVDALLVVHAGWGWEDSGRLDHQGRPLDLASHYARIARDTADPGPGGAPVRLADYVFVPEESYKLDLVRNGESPPVDNGNEPLVEIGVLCHELGHLLGLPDLYDTTFFTNGVGTYCLMGYGLWGPNYDGGVQAERLRVANQPTHLSAWAKAKLGWLIPTDHWGDGPFSLRRAETFPEALRLYAEAEGREYFLLEHRQSTGFDFGFPGLAFRQGALVLWHVDENALEVGGSLPNNYPLKGVDVECADALDAAGSDDLDTRFNFGDLGDWWFGARAFGPATVPDSRNNFGRSTGVAVWGLSGIVSNLTPMTGSASAGQVVLNPRSPVVTARGHGFADLAWLPSPAADVVAYRVYDGTTQLAEVPGRDTTTGRVGGLDYQRLYFLRVAAVDQDGHESDGAAFAPFQPANAGPTLPNPGPQDHAEGQGVSLTLVASDADGDPLTFAATGLPPGLALDPARGVVSGTLGFEAAGVYPVVLTVSDGTLAASASLTWTVADVNRPPTAPAAALTTPEDVPLAGAVDAQDPDGDPLAFALAFGPSRGSVSLHPTTGAFTYTPLPDFHGADAFAVRVTDGRGGESLATIAVTVTPVNDPPRLTGTPASSVRAGSPYAFTPGALDPDGDPLTFAIANQPAWATFDPATGAVTGVPTSRDAGKTLAVVISVTDGRETVALPPFDLEVLPAPDGGGGGGGCFLGALGQ